jgi:hypothetical protein
MTRSGGIPVFGGPLENRWAALGLAGSHVGCEWSRGASDGGVLSRLCAIGKPPAQYRGAVETKMGYASMWRLGMTEKCPADDYGIGIGWKARGAI